MRERRFGVISYNQIIWILTVVLLAGFIILEKYSWGKYFFLLISGLIFAIDNLTHRGSSIPLGPFQIRFGLFIAYCFMTSLWALRSSNAIEFSITLVLIYICLLLIAPYYIRQNDISELLSAIMWASVIVAIYTVSFYGIDTLIAASKTQYVRLGNDYSNINTVGMFCAFGVVVQFEKWLYNKKFQFSMPFLLICVLVVACTQSRKALLLMVGGCVIIATMKNYNKEDIMKSVFKIMGIVLVLGALVFLISQIGIFSGVQERLRYFVSFLSGTGELDSGSINRQLMAELGIKVWKEHPLFGVGLNCTRIVVNQSMGQDAYMHNNFVEVLCATGLVGFLLYYSMYVYILRQLIKYREYDKQYFIFGIMWFAVSLIMDLGMVSYYGKTQCFYLFVQFINVSMMKSKAKAYRYEGGNIQ